MEIKRFGTWYFWHTFLFCIEILRDLKASNAEQRYLSGLSGKIRAVEK